METAVLIDLCKQGDKDALGNLYRIYSKRMMKVICHYVTDLSVAQDILHDGFLIVFSRIDQLRDISKIEYWMGSIMKNLALQYLKETDFIQLLSDDFDIPDTPEFGESISIEELEVMINRLPIGYRKVFKLAVLEHKTHKEIGKLLGISEQTSGSQLFHARVMLRKMITEYKIEMGLGLIGLVVISGLFLKTRSSLESHTSSLLSECPKNILPISENIETEPKVKGNSHMSLPLEPMAKPEQSFINADTICNIDVKGSVMMNNDSITNSLDQIAQSNVDTIPDNPLAKTPTSSYLHLKKTYPTSAESFNKGIGVSLRGNAFGQGQINHPSLQMPADPNLTNPGDVVEEKIIHNIPISFSVNISKSISERWYLDCGVQYNLLKSKIIQTKNNGNKVVSTCVQQIRTDYIGIPLQIRYEFLSLDRLSFYSGMGGSVQIPIKGRLSTTKNDRKVINSQFTPSVQWSVNGSLGIEYRVSSNIGFFAEPSINYYFKSGTEYPIIWQDKPLEFSIPIGLRFTW